MATSPAKARKVTMTLVDSTAGSGHRFGVSSLASTSSASWGDGSQLLSAGRDGTICAWSYNAEQPSQPELSFVLEDHTDWVNDLVLLQEGGQASGAPCPLPPRTSRPDARPAILLLMRSGSRAAALPALVSCSSDTTLKVWRPSGQPGQAARCHTMRRHTDYVKALAYAPQARLLASASCDRTVLLWDLHTLQPCGGSGTGEGVRARATRSPPPPLRLLRPMRPLAPCRRRRTAIRSTASLPTRALPCSRRARWITTCVLEPSPEPSP